MAITFIIVYLAYILFILIYGVLIRLKLLKHKSLEPITYVILGLCTLSLGIISIAKGQFCYIDSLGLIPLGVGVFSIGIALFAMGKSEDAYEIQGESYKAQDTTIKFLFHNEVDRLRDSRRRLWKDFDEYRKDIANLDRKIRQKESLLKPVKGRLTSRIEFATWDGYTAIRKTKVLQHYLDKKDQKIILKSLYILVNNLIKRELIGVLKKRHIEHLLMATRDAMNFEGFEDLKDDFYNVFQRLLPEKEDFDFKEYILFYLKQMRNKKDELFRTNL